MEYLLAFAPQGGGGGGGMVSTLIMFAAIFAIFYFMIIRPQQKRAKERQRLLTALKKGDKIVTIGGIHGTIAGFKDKGKLVIIKTGKTGDLTVNKSAIAGLAGNVSEEETSNIEGQA